jgi:hypothetical protein
MNTEYQSKNLDHLGIVSQICDEIGIVEAIDQILPPDPSMKISHGECVKLMLINGLGFTSRPLYLEAQFFSSRPVNRFLMKDCEDAINDDRLRRTLDKLFAAGCDPLFASIASRAALRFEVSTKFRHLDSTSMQVHGEYDKDEGIGLVTFGYSKDHRPDLKQFMIYLMSSQDGEVKQHFFCKFDFLLLFSSQFIRFSNSGLAMDSYPNIAFPLSTLRGFQLSRRSPTGELMQGLEIIQPLLFAA